MNIRRNSASHDVAAEQVGDARPADEEVCVCFHVSRRKIENFIRNTRPRRASQLAECYGAGTGCGWCRRFLVEMLEAARNGTIAALPSRDEYLSHRRQYHRKTGWNEPEQPGSE